MQNEVAFRSLVDTLVERANKTPNQLAYAFLGDGERETGRKTYAALDAAARGIAAELRPRFELGARVLLLYSDGLDFVLAFFGCLYAGIIPVPTYPPLRGKRLSTCSDIARKSEARGVLTTSDQANALRRALAGDPLLHSLPLLLTDRCAEAGNDLEPRECAPRDVAFIQFTSGTTGHPKGVIVTHGNLVNNQQAVERAFEHDARTVFVGWLPLFHDMGLIGNVLQPMYLGIPAILMPPASFLQRPVRWLNAISKYRGTTSGAPNFAYELCVARVTAEQKAALDLSSWSVAFNGSEPLRHETLQRFSQAFAASGFDARAHYPCYGMAEATLFVAGGKRGTQRVISVESAPLERHRVELAQPARRSSKTLVSCGRPCLGNELRIVDPYSYSELGPDQVGEIWLHGPSVTRGYWGEPELTANTFEARLRHMPNGRSWLRTGDLGFVHDGELYVTGRLRDSIDLRGRHLYPHDIELTAERSHPHIGKGRVAAFGVEDCACEELVVLAEVDFSARAIAQPDAMADAIRDAVAREHEVTLRDVRILRPSTLAVTSSGKMRRRSSRELYLSDQLAHFSRGTSADAVSGLEPSERAIGLTQQEAT